MMPNPWINPEPNPWLDTDEDLYETCNHKPGRFLGQCQSPNYERYQCAVCGEEITVRIENK